jgi:hypothetical protein
MLGEIQQKYLEELAYVTCATGVVGSAACTGEGLKNFATQDTAFYGPNAPLFSLWYAAKQELPDQKLGQTA